MKHFGDITKIRGADAPPVDAVIGGSPCQGYPEEKNIPKFQRESLKYKGLSAKTSG